MPDLLGGRIAMWFGNTLAVLPHVRSGKLRGIAVSSARRIDAAKDIPTVAESGLSGFNAVAWFGLVAPAATPSAVLTKVNQDMIKVIAMADVRAKFIENGGEIIGNTPAQFTAQVKAEIASKGALIRASGAKVD
jgi:tripartite-type tricarboxylate transporter receptor subunit TctC